MELNKIFYRNMVEGVTIPLMVIGRDGRILHANRSSEKFTGYRRDELLRRNIRDLCAPYEQERYIFSTLPSIKETTQVDIDLRKKNNQVFMASVSFAPFEHDRLMPLLLTLQDVTVKRVQEGKTREEEERYRRLLAERNVLREQVNQSSKLAYMGELAAGIAHEVNNPLGIILGFVEDILEDISEEHPLFESIKIIQQEASLCVAVVKDLLDFARLKPPERSNADILQILEDTVSLLIPRIRKSKIQVRRAYDKGLPLIEIDSHLVQQVFLNVMINAIQAMPDGGRLELGISLVENDSREVAGRWIWVALSDTGHGISGINMGRVFDPFFSTKGSKGTGLGLSVCRRIMDEHGGRIDLENRADAGVRCNLYFPLKG